MFAIAVGGGWPALSVIFGELTDTFVSGLYIYMYKHWPGPSECNFSYTNIVLQCIESLNFIWGPNFSELSWMDVISCIVLYHNINELILFRNSLWM